MQGKVEKKVKKLEKTMNSLYVKNLVLEVRVANLQTMVNIEKVKRKHDKGIMSRFDQEGETKTMFFSSSKIKAAQQCLQEEKQKKDTTEIQKKKKKH